MRLLGKRPVGKGDDMDKWLEDQEKKGGPGAPGETSAPPPLEPEPTPDPLPSPGLATSSAQVAERTTHL